mmetsp:Transcript_111739/g.301396  ORF Transcript_111739/g.301396 Transcript_111739/m.301396 type:complete len:83 (-) Transcript_111739:56-304(-)
MCRCAGRSAWLHRASPGQDRSCTTCAQPAVVATVAVRRCSIRPAGAGQILQDVQWAALAVPSLQLRLFVAVFLFVQIFVLNL